MLRAGFLRAEQQLRPVKVNCEALGTDPSGDFFEKFKAVLANLHATAGNGKGRTSVISAIGRIRKNGDRTEGCGIVHVDELTLSGSLCGRALQVKLRT